MFSVPVAGMAVTLFLSRGLFFQAICPVAEVRIEKNVVPDELELQAICERQTDN